MKIDLYNPPSGQRRYMPIINLPTLAAVISQAGHDVRASDLCDAGSVNYLSGEPDVIGFTSTTSNQDGVKAAIKQLRSDGFTGKVVVGGIYATLWPEKAYGWGADLVVTGECEGNVVHLIENEVGICPGEAMPIDQIPAPKWDSYYPNLATYKGSVSLVRPKPAITMWSRGCPYRCIFCENRIFNSRPTLYRPPANIEKEMRYLHDNGFVNVFIYDDELVGSRIPDGWMAEVADRVGPMRFRMVTQGRCSQRFITEDLMRDVRKAGIHTVFWGVESFSNKVLSAMRKGITQEDIFHTLRIAKAAGVSNALYIQVGNYQETSEDASQTCDALKRVYREGLVDYINVFITGVMPGTALEKIAKDEGWWKPLPHDVEMKKTYNDTPWMTKGEIKSWRYKFLQACPTRSLN